MPETRMVRFGSVDKALHRLVMLVSAMVMIAMVSALLLPPETLLSEPDFTSYGLE